MAATRAAAMMPFEGTQPTLRQSPPMRACSTSATRAPKPAAPECHFCGTGFTTSPGGGAPSHWGHGADCASAQSDVRSQLLAYVNADCQNYGTAGRCSFQVVYTCSCYYQGGQWVVDAYANYGCWVYYC